MSRELIFRVAFWALFAGVLAMRIAFAIRMRRAGERVMPDQEAVEREGRVMFASRALLFFILISLDLFSRGQGVLEVDFS